MVRYGLGLLEAAMTMTRQWVLITSELTSISPTSVCDPAVLLTMSTLPGPNVSRHSFHASYVPDELRNAETSTPRFNPVLNDLKISQNFIELLQNASLESDIEPLPTTGQPNVTIQSKPVGRGVPTFPSIPLGCRLR